MLLFEKAARPLALSWPPPLLLVLLLSDDNRTGKKNIWRKLREHFYPPVYFSHRAFIFVVCFQPFNFVSMQFQSCDLLNQNVYFNVKTSKCVLQQFARLCPRTPNWETVSWTWIYVRVSVWTSCPELLGIGSLAQGHISSAPEISPPSSLF